MRDTKLEAYNMCVPLLIVWKLAPAQAWTLKLTESVCGRDK